MRSRIRRSHSRSSRFSSGPWCTRAVAGTTKTSANEPSGQAAKSDIKPGTTVKVWIMPNGPQPQEDMEAALVPFTEETGIKVDVEVVDWGVQLDRIRNAAVSGEGPDITQAGTTQVPFFAALGGFEDLSSRVEDIGGSGAYADGVWQTTQVVGQDGVVGGPVVHRGAVDLLPQGHPREGRRRPGDRVRGLGLVPGHAAGDQGQGPGHPAVRHARQEGVRPRPPRDAVRVGRRRR